MMKAKMAVISALLGLAGCASTTGPVTFPPDWGSIRSTPTADGCPFLAGMYSNQSTDAFPAPVRSLSSLSDIFTRMAQAQGAWGPGASGRAWPAIPVDATSASIEQQPEALRVTFANAQGEQATLDFRRYHFSWTEAHYDDLFTCYLAAGEPRLRFFAEPESHSGSSPISLNGGEPW